MTRLGMVINIDACIGCYNCVISCKDEHVGNEWPPYSAAQPDTGQFWISLIEKERALPQAVKVTYTPIPCMQCKDAPCVEAAMGGAAYTRRDGIVVLDPVKAKGQKQIVDSCPYGVIFWNDEKQIPQKCTFCAHLLDLAYKQPRCVEACPTNAIIFGDLDDPSSEISKLGSAGITERLHPELGIDTAVRYVDLPKPMIGGSVLFEDTGECAVDVDVTIFDGSAKTVRTKTNNYGDFLVESLSPGRKYEVRLEYPEYSTKNVSVSLDGDMNLGDIVMQRR